MGIDKKSLESCDNNCRKTENEEGKEKKDEEVSLKDFLAEYKDVLETKLRAKLAPVFNPLESDTWSDEQKERLKLLKRTLYPAQINAVLALAKGYQNKKSLILTAECGTGKTIMSLATAYLMGAKRIIVMCPGHLVQKWIREARETIPDVTCINLNGKGLGDLQELKKGFGKCVGTEIYVIGKERAKLHYRTIPAYSTNKKGDVICSDCGRIVDDPKRAIQILKGKRVHCSNELVDSRQMSEKGEPKSLGKCNSEFYQADKATQRYSKAEYLKRYVGKGFFDLCIADEVHELKGGNSAQGQAFANFCSISKHVIGLTGTLMGGYATNLYYVFWRMFPQSMSEMGYSFYNSIKFANDYGIIETSVITTENAISNDSSIGGHSKTRTYVKEKPGISPLMLTNFLLENTIFMKLSDVTTELPPYREDIIQVQMDTTQQEQYDNFEDSIMSKVRSALLNHDKSLLGVMLQSLLALPDAARRGEIAVHPHSPDPLHPTVLAVAKPLNIEVLPKENELLSIIANEVAKGRKILVCLEHTGTRDLTGDLVERIITAGYNAVVLKANTVKPELRETWIREKTKNEDFDVLITNPRIIQTGLDLLEYPTIVFFQTGYSVFTLRQASRRSWRIGQKQDVNIFYLAYAETLQEKALKLMATKMETALAIEGDLSDKGLVALSEGDSSILFALARELMNDNGKGKQKSLADTWNSYKKAEIESDSLITDDEPIITTTVIAKGDKRNEVSYTTISRGYVYPKMIKGKKVGVAILDNGSKLVFWNNSIYWKKRTIGQYDNNSGNIAEKAIELVPAKVNGKRCFQLIEKRMAANAEEQKTQV